MDALRERIQEDLRGLISGDVHCDELFVQMYASDASIHEIVPLGVVRPRNTADVVACLQYSGENSIPVHARGAGTGLAGESVGPGIVLDFSRYMRRVVRTEDGRVRVQPGLVHALLNQHLAETGRQFGPDPAMSHVTTMGSVVAIDASGSHWLKYGSARRHVESLEIVLADGEVMEVGREPLTRVGTNGSPRKRELVLQLAALVKRNADVIAHHRPQTRVNGSGYGLWDVLEDGHLDLARLLVGSEGTLALITEATLATQPLPAHRGVLLLLFERLENASKAVERILRYGPSACDLMDRRHLSLARESDVLYDVLIPIGTESILLVEKQGESPQEVRDSLTQIAGEIRTKRRLAFGSHLAMDRDEVDRYWQLARRFVPTLYRLKGSTRPLPFVEDVAIPPESLPQFLVALQNLLKRHQVIASLFAHVGHGQLHIRPFLDLANPDHIRTMEVLAADLYQQVFDVGGTISGEHGDGLSRTPFLRQQYGPLCDVFREVKRIFDPREILNPGKIVQTEPQSIVANLRPVAALVDEVPRAEKPEAPENAHAPVDLQLNWTPEEMSLAARQCNGCGACRSQTGDVRMCPIFHFAPREEASPRAKANLMRGILTGRLDLEVLGRDDFKDVADLCVHCHQCRLECPANVDIPKLMVEAKAAYIEANGLQLSDWVMTRIDTLSYLASRLPGLANWAITNRPARWLAEKLLGISQSRKLPRLASKSFLRVAGRRRLTRSTRRSGLKVLYFVDTYASYHDVQLAEAVVHVFEHNGIAVYVHPDQRPSGMPMIAHGAVDKARRVAQANIALLAEAVRQGYHIVASEPSAVLCLTREYQQLTDDDEARVVAEHTSDACHYLWRLHQQGKLQLDFRPVSLSLGYHMPCHLKALEVGSPGENLLRLIPGLSVTPIERGCSGMAGTYGLKRENYRNSLRAGWGLISALRAAPVQAGASECSTCKMQMEQGTTKPTLHPIKLLAHAYGQLPDVERLIKTPGEDLVVT